MECGFMTNVWAYVGMTITGSLVLSCVIVAVFDPPPMSLISRQPPKPPEPFPPFKGDE